MFTGLIEEIGIVSSIDTIGDGKKLTITCKTILEDMGIDASIAVNGVCLTVIEFTDSSFSAIAIEETLSKTTLGNLEVGKRVNLERAMLSSTRYGGHIVQGHVDQTAEIYDIEEKEGSWNFTVKFIKKPKFTLVDKGSVCIDGVSLTVVKAKKRKFIVSIIPYTFRHTLFYTYKAGTVVNIEFDVIGKYVETLIKKYR